MSASMWRDKKIQKNWAVKRKNVYENIINGRDIFYRFGEVKNKIISIDNIERGKITNESEQAA